MIGPGNHQDMMIHYELRCAEGHGFDGWFRGSANFDAQADAGLVVCPVCASTRVSRALMAPFVPRRATPSGRVAAQEAASETRAVAVPAAARPAAAPAPMPDQLRAALQRLRAEVEQSCDYVGPRFAEAARAIHDGDEPPRPIYGEATQTEAEALAEDGIEIASIPWIPRAES